MKKLYFAHMFGKKRYAKDPVLSDKMEILESEIKNICIIIKPLISYELRKKFQVFINQAPKNPAKLSYANYTHACFMAKVENNGEQYDILIENGGYDDRREGDYKAQVHYFYESQLGLRFVKLTNEDVQNLNAKGNQIIPCSVDYHITVEQLFFDSQFCGKVHIWSFYDFNIIEQNCQLFVRKVVHILGAKRINDLQKETDYTKKYIPFKISTALEDNEMYRVTNEDIRYKIDKSKIKHFSNIFPTPDHVLPDSIDNFLFELLKKYDELIVRTIY